MLAWLYKFTKMGPALCIHTSRTVLKYSGTTWRRKRKYVGVAQPDWHAQPREMSVDRLVLYLATRQPIAIRDDG